MIQVFIFFLQFLLVKIFVLYPRTHTIVLWVAICFVFVYCWPLKLNELGI